MIFKELEDVCGYGFVGLVIGVCVFGKIQFYVFIGKFHGGGADVNTGYVCSISCQRSDGETSGIAKGVEDGFAGSMLPEQGPIFSLV